MIGTRTINQTERNLTCQDCKLYTCLNRSLFNSNHSYVILHKCLGIWLPVSQNRPWELSPDMHTLLTVLNTILKRSKSFIGLLQFSCSVMSDSATPWTAAHQASLSITNSQSLLKLISIELVMPSNHFILCRPLLLLPPITPSIRVFSSESTLRMRWPKYWSFGFSISPSNEHPGLIPLLRWTAWIFLQSKGLSRVFSTTTVQKHQFFSTQLSSQSNSHIHP